ncbi:cytosolic iron-sulfur protein assembly protein 1 [Penicillium sp. IBT 31633x]|nr:cytosolic iron-sulfur protein assembly protein 1 [Penicillium sp. IBT 31633x]
MIRRNSDIEIQLPDAGPTPLSPESSEFDVVMLSEEPIPPVSLPPHIAARFYRKSSKIRRSSVASSRRSSVSSLHSHHSNASSNGSPSADHIAQHLRRASILESRKARLADRALHAEKVRLRAALAKAATRNLQIEERALAAQQTRERLLADITAKCEDQVRRAKKKAEDQREKKATEEARLRLEMTEKFAEAEKRRTLYRQTHRRQRTSSLPATEEKKMSREATKSLTEDAAARKIQRVWKTHHAKMVMQQFRSLSLSVDRVHDMSFEEVGALLSNSELLDTMTRVLRLCGLQDMEGGAMGERGAVRTFLSSYLIVTHPKEVLSSDGDQEQDLIAKARELLVAFDQVTALLSSGCCSPSVITADLQTLCESHNVFFSAFHAWKTHDSTVLIDIMVAQFVELELIWQTVKNDKAGGAAEDYRQGIRQNQVLLLARLKRLAGPDRHMEMIRGSLKKAKREKKRAASKQAIPRSAETAPPITDALTESVASPLSESFNNIDAGVFQELDKQRTSPHERFTRILTPLPENRELVHELLINKEYKIEEAPYTEPRKHIMNQMCDTMRKEVEAGHGSNWTVAMATVIQDRLLRSLQRGNSLYVMISEVLDPKLVQGQCEAGTFSYDNFFEFMNNILPRLCAPYRDPAVKAYIEDTSGDTIDRLARLMGIIDLLSLDQTNFMIQLAAPQLIEEAPGYEKRAFDRGVTDGTISLSKTRRFWRTHRKIIVDEMKKRDPEGIQGEPHPPSARVYAQGLADTVLSNAIVSADLVPETLSLDRQRLERLHAKSFQIVATASILLTAKNLLKRDARSQWKPEADRILSLDFNEITAERVQSILESTHPMPPAASAQLAATIKRVLGPVATACLAAAPQLAVVRLESSASEIPFLSTDLHENTASMPSFSDPVAKLILSRLRSHVLSRLSASSATERVRATTTASQSLAAAGMPEFVNEVGKLVEELEKVREVDWLCHGAISPPPSQERTWLTAPHPTLPIVATCSSDKTIRVYSLTNFTLLSTITGGHKRSVRTAAWKPHITGESVLATGSFDATVGIWRRWDSYGREDGTGWGMGKEITKESATAASKPTDADAASDREEDEEEWRFAVLLDGHDSEVKSVSWSASGMLLATCSRDKSIWIWEDLDDGDNNFETVAVMQEHGGDVKCVAWHPTEECLASGSYDDTIRVWREDLDDWGQVACIKGHGGTVWFLDWEREKNVPRALSSPQAESELSALQAKWQTQTALSGPRLISCSDDRTVRVWRRQPKQAQQQAALSSAATGIPSIIRPMGTDEMWEEDAVLPHAHELPIYAVAWSKRSGLVASTGADGRIAIYEERFITQTQTQEQTDPDAMDITSGDGPALPRTEWVLVAVQDGAHGIYEVNHVAWAKRADRGSGSEEEEVLVSTADDGSVKVWTVTR